MQDCDYLAKADEMMQRIRQGAFLTVLSGAALNTMTIGWATFGVIWRRPILMVAVRPSRHTFSLIEKAPDFTVTVPAGGREEALSLCGSRSGRDVDKFALCGLATTPGRCTATPVIGTAGRHYECRIVCRTALDPARLDPEVSALIYPRQDFSSLYFGEVLACYETE